jgi:hypothetical protein
VRAAFEIIHEVGHDVRGAGLPRKLEIFAREHVTIQSQSELHEHSSVVTEAVSPHHQMKKRFCSAISRGACTFKPSLPFYFKKEISNQGIPHKIVVSSIP